MFRCTQQAFFDAVQDEQEAVVLENVRVLNALNGSTSMTSDRVDEYERTGAPLGLTAVSWISLHMTRYGELKRPALNAHPNCVFKVYSVAPGNTAAAAVFTEIDVYSTEHLALSTVMAHAAVRTETRMNEIGYTPAHMHRRAQWAIFRARANFIHSSLINSAYQNVLRASFYSTFELLAMTVSTSASFEPTMRFPLQEQRDELASLVQ